MLLTQEQINQFVNDGACVVSNAISQSVIEKAEAEMDAQHSPETLENNHIRQYILGDGYELLMQDPALEQLALEALGAEAVHMVATASLYTPPGLEDAGYAEDRTHVDIQYRSQDWLQTPRNVLLTMMIFLDDVPADRAPTLISPRSHMLLAKHNDDLEDFSTDPMRIADLPQLDYSEMQPLCGKKGDVALATTAVLHRGSPNTTTKPRKLLFISFTSQHICPMFNSNWLEQRISYLEDLRSRFAPERRHLLDSSIAMMKQDQIQMSA